MAPKLEVTSLEQHQEDLRWLCKTAASNHAATVAQQQIEIDYAKVDDITEVTIYHAIALIPAVSHIPPASCMLVQEYFKVGAEILQARGSFSMQGLCQ